MKDYFIFTIYQLLLATSGVRDAYNLGNTNVLMAAMDSIREDPRIEHISKTYESISKTAQQIPFDSAIFLSTDSIPIDKDHQQVASMILLKKRIRVSDWLI